MDSPRADARSPKPPFVAFLSYRHVDPDRRWANWLLRRIESYRVPRHVGGGVRRLGKVFRDEEELGASADLSAAIRDALERSRHLVVICSPRTPASTWVDREIQSFHDLGKGDRIVAFLGEGSSSESFPQALRSLQREPLAADARPRPGTSARRARETALLRVLARLIGCEYDDLRQREQQRRQRFWRSVAVAASVLVLAFAAITALAVRSRNEARRERDRALALGMAQAAGAAAEQDTQLALLLARRAVALDAGPPTRSRLRQALAAPGVRWRLPASGMFLGLAASPGGARWIVHELGGRIRVVDDDGRVLAEHAGAKVAFGPRFAPDGSFALVAGPEGTLLRLSPDGVVEARATPEAGSEYSDPWIDPTGGTVWVRDGERILCLDAHLVEQRRIDARGLGPRSFLPMPDGEQVLVLGKDGGLWRLPGEAADALVVLPSWGARTLVWDEPGRSLLVADPPLQAARRVDLGSDPPQVTEWPSAGVLLPLEGLEAVTASGVLQIREREGTVRLQREADDVRRIEVDTDGSAVVALTREDVVVLDAGTGAGTTWTGARAARPLEVASARGGTRLLLATKTEGVWAVDVSHAELGAHRAPRATAAWLADGTAFLAIAGSRVERFGRDGRLEQLYLTAGRRVRAAAGSADAALVAAGFADGTCRIWTAAGAVLADVDAGVGAVLDVQAHPAGGWVVAGAGHAARLLGADGRLGARLAGHPGPVTRLAISSDGARLLTGSDGEEVRLWDGAGAPRSLLHLGGDPVRFAGFLAGSHHAALVGPSRARVFDGNAEVVGFLEAGSETFEDGIATPDGRLLVFGTRVRMLDASGHTQVLPSAAVRGARLAQDGRHALLWTPGSFADLLDVARGATVSLGGHAGNVTAAAFLPADAGLATGTSRGAVHLWTRTGHLRAVLELGDAPVRDLAPDPTGRHLLVGDEHGVLRHVLLDDDEVDALAAARTRRDFTWRERRTYAEFLGDPGPDPTPARVEEAIAALDALAAMGPANEDTPAMRARTEQVDDLVRELAPGAPAGEQLPYLLAAIGRHRPDDAHRLEAALRLTGYMVPATRRKLEALHRKLEAFRKEHGRHPTDDEGLGVVDVGGQVLGTGAVQGSPLLDAWGALFLYRLEGEGYVLSSAGPDGVHGTGDDVR